MSDPDQVPVDEPTEALAAFLDEELGDHQPVRVAPMVGGGSCEIFAVDRASRRLVLRRAPSHASSSTAHDVLREHRILAAVAGHGVRIATPVAACADPAVFGAPFYVMERIDGVPVRGGIPEAWAADVASQPRAVEELVDALVEVHAVDWRAVGLGDLGRPDRFLERQVDRWLSQLASYAAATCRPPCASAPGSTPTGPPSRRPPSSTATTSSTTCCSPPTPRRGCSPSSTGRWPRSATRWSTSRGR